MCFAVTGTKRWKAKLSSPHKYVAGSIRPARQRQCGSGALVALLLFRHLASENSVGESISPMPHLPSAARPSGAFVIRRLRLGTGLVLFAYVTSHLTNHALGLFGLGAMEAGRPLFLALWRNPVGMFALYGSLTTHLALAFWSIYQRRQFRIPLWESAQLLLGLLIPLLLIRHAISTHLAGIQYGAIDSYTRMMLSYWSRPEMGIRQVLLLLIAWTHGCIGLHFWLRINPWYPRVAQLMAALALLIPLLALLGFVGAMREITELTQRPGWVQAALVAAKEPTPAQRHALNNIVDGVLAGFLFLLLFTLASRYLRNRHELRHRSICIAYPNGQKVTVPIGYTVLEASRYAGIGHAAVCGGRGRCSTCRIHVLQGLADLPAAGSEEADVLKLAGATADTRLACQLRPTKNVSVAQILPASTTALHTFALPDNHAAQEKIVCVLFVDIRGFTRFAERKLPYDVVFVLNRYFEITGRAIEEAHGITSQFSGDGVMALFGVNGSPEQGCRDALNAAHAIARGLAEMSRELWDELREPLRFGIGIHAGPVVVGLMGRGAAKNITAIGDAVNVASRLQDLTKDYHCQMIVSASVAQHAGINTTLFELHELTVRNRTEPIAIFTIPNAQTLVA